MKRPTLRDILPLHYFTLPYKTQKVIPSKRYLAGIASYGKPVKSEKRKARIIAELNAMGVKPRIRVKMGKRVIGFKAYRASMQGPKRMQSTRFLFAGPRRYA